MSTRLHKALLSGKTHIVADLLRSGEDPNIYDLLVGRPLHFAASRGNLQFVKLLVKYGADVNMKHHIWKTTALHVASKKGRIAMMKVLLDHGAKVNTDCWFGQSRCKWGYTPLHGAAEYGHATAVKLLLFHGADPNYRGKYGRSAKEVGTCKEVKKVFTRYEKMQNEWRPWNHSSLPVNYRRAMRQLVILAKLSINYKNEIRYLYLLI